MTGVAALLHTQLQHLFRQPVDVASPPNQIQIGGRGHRAAHRPRQNRGLLCQQASEVGESLRGIGHT